MYSVILLATMSMPADIPAAQQKSGGCAGQQAAGCQGQKAAPRGCAGGQAAPTRYFVVEVRESGGGSGYTASSRRDAFTPLHDIRLNRLDARIDRRERRADRAQARLEALD